MEEAPQTAQPDPEPAAPQPCRWCQSVPISYTTSREMVTFCGCKVQTVLLNTLDA